MRMCAQNIATPTIILNFCEENFRDYKSNHEIHENIVPRKFGAIRYYAIPDDHKPFWTQLGIDGINCLYTSLTVTPDKVLKIIDGDCRNPSEERVFRYLTSLIGNMGTNDLRIFLRFTTGSSVCIADKITVAFNSSSGLARRPIAHTFQHP